MKVLIVNSGVHGDMLFLETLNSEHTHIVPIAKNVAEKFLLRILRKAREFAGGGGIPQFFFRHWLMKIENYDYLILFDNTITYLSTNVLSLITDRKVKKCIMLWKGIQAYEEKKTEENFKLYPLIRYLYKYKPLVSLENRYKIYSYEQNDCNQYGFTYVSTFYNPSITLKVIDDIYDVFFLGAAKKREKKLSEIFTLLQSLGLNPYFHVLLTYNDRKINRNELPFKTTRKTLKYMDSLNLLAQSKAILDIVADGQEGGLSLRIMEALFFDKKIITDNSSIKSLSFYSSKMIYILGEDKRSISDFLLEKTEQFPDSAKKFYSFDSWLKRLTENYESPIRNFLT